MKKWILVIIIVGLYIVGCLQTYEICQDKWKQEKKKLEQSIKNLKNELKYKNIDPKKLYIPLKKE